MSGYKIKGRGNTYYDIFNDEYFVAGSESFSTLSTWKKNNNVITIDYKLTTSRGNAQYKATTNSKFRSGPYNGVYFDILNNNNTNKLVSKYTIIQTNTDIDIHDRYNRILIVAIGGGGGGERGTANRGGSPGGTGATVASFVTAPSGLKITIGAGGGGGTGRSGANGHSGGTTIVKDNNNNILVQASGTGGGAGGTPTPTNVGATGFQDLDYIVDGNSGLRGAGGAGGGRRNKWGYEPGYNGTGGTAGVVYIYYFHN